MNYRYFFLLFLITITSNYSNAQSMSDYFKYEGVALLAGLAHPTNTYKSGSYSVYRDEVRVTIKYENYTTKLKIRRSGDFFTRVEVTSDTDWWPAFTASEIIKDLIIEALEEDRESREALSQLEKWFNKKLYDMTGTEMACVLLTVGWFGY